MKVLICLILMFLFTTEITFARGDHARGKNQQARRNMHLNRQEARADGKVTKEERKALHQEKKELREKRNDASKEIYEQKHDSDNQPPKSTEDLIKDTDQEPEEE